MKPGSAPSRPHTLQEGRHRGAVRTRGRGSKRRGSPAAAPRTEERPGKGPRLSPAQRQVLEFIRRFLDEHGYMPTVQEVQKGCGLSSSSVANYNLQALAQMGYLRRIPRVARGLQLLGPGGRRRRRMVTVPLVGAIAAGEPAPAAGEGEELLELPAELLGGRENVFALRVRGRSMVDALVDDGDIVVLEQTAAVRDGEMAVVRLRREGEVTLKRLYREGDRVRLQPLDEAMPPIYAGVGNVEVQGRVVAVLRQMQREGERRDD